MIILCVSSSFSFTSGNSDDAEAGHAASVVVRALVFTPLSVEVDEEMMRGKTVIVTGANSGIGKATAAELLRREARVIMACRSRERGESAAQDIRQQAGTASGELLLRLVDLASLCSVRSFCDQINKVTSITNTQTSKLGI